MAKTGEHFIHSRNTDLHHSQAVESVASYLRTNGETIAHEKPHEKIGAYIGFLANKDYVNDGILTGDQPSIERQMNAFVIAPQNVPESYFDLERRIAREQGYGDIEITDTVRAQKIEALRADQRESLRNWTSYLNTDDAGYPDWFKLYVWESLAKLGTYDKQKQAFNNRTKETVAAYPDLNREALAYVYDVLHKSKILEQKVDGGRVDAELQELLQGANFGKIYALAIKEISPASAELRKQTKGEWVKYGQIEGDYTTEYIVGENGEYYDPNHTVIEDPTALRLAKSLQGHGTGWCTAGESTAAVQLSGGDFYVYYTYDDDGKTTIPRIAIRMQGGEVQEVRGIDAKQELEANMIEIMTVKLEELPGGESYFKKAEDMKHLTRLDAAQKAGEKFSVKDLKFLYQLEGRIEGFGYESDPRIIEIKAARDAAQDLQILFGTKDHTEIANILIEKSNYECILQNIDVLTGIDQYVIAMSMMRNKYKLPRYYAQFNWKRLTGLTAKQVDDIEEGWDIIAANML